MENDFNGTERRKHPRISIESPLAYKVCNPNTLSKLFQGYTVNVSNSGLLCTMNNIVNIDDVLWLSFNKSVLLQCQEIEKHSFFYQNGILGKVVRVDTKDAGHFEVGINFLTKEEPNLTNIFSREYFVEKNEKNR
jgi:c-di-GMP-binding flagellar brake protein YcgR